MILQQGCLVVLLEGALGLAERLWVSLYMVEYLEGEEAYPLVAACYHRETAELAHTADGAGFGVLWDLIMGCSH
jgi:hypothetical protein